MPSPPRVIWAYTYHLVPPQAADRLREVRSLLADEHLAASRREATWHGRLVADDRVSHILVLSDSPNLTLEANARIEAALRAIEAVFTITVPMAVGDDLGDAAASLAPTD